CRRIRDRRHLRTSPPRRSSDLPSVVRTRASGGGSRRVWTMAAGAGAVAVGIALAVTLALRTGDIRKGIGGAVGGGAADRPRIERSEEHTSELQSRFDLVCRRLL